LGCDFRNYFVGNSLRF